MNKKIRLLVINPGSTSTKIAVFENEKNIFGENVCCSVEELSKFKEIYDQHNFRKDVILKTLDNNGIDINSLDAVIGIGGLLKPVKFGIYKVNKKMLEDLRIGISGKHPCNLGGIIADEIATDINKPSYVVGPASVDELENIARISGMAEIERISMVHAPNQKAVAKKFAAFKGKKYKDLNLIITHLGGGISVAVHKGGKIIDVNNALDGEGPFSPERTGNVPVGDLVDLCYSGKYTHDEMRKKIRGKGGLVSYLGTNNARKVKEMVKSGNKKAESIYRAMAYQVAKEIGSCAVVLDGKVDGIILTGGIAYDKLFTSWIEEKVKFISEVYIYPGEYELSLFAMSGLKVLRGEEEAMEYN